MASPKPRPAAPQKHAHVTLKAGFLANTYFAAGAIVYLTKRAARLFVRSGQLIEKELFDKKKTDQVKAASAAAVAASQSAPAPSSATAPAAPAETPPATPATAPVAASAPQPAPSDAQEHEEASTATSEPVSEAAAH